MSKEATKRETKETLEQQIDKTVGESQAGLVKREQQAMVAPSECDGTLAGVVPGDLIVPRMRIVQPQSKPAIRGEETAGTFRSNLGVEKKTMLVVPLAVARGQVLWGEQGEGEPLCKSPDGMRPDARVESPPSHTCHRLDNGRLVPVCPKAKWGAGRRPPECASLFTMVMLDAEDGGPFVIRFSKTSLQCARVLLTRAWQLKAPLYGLRAKMVLSLTENDRGSYYVPSFAIVDKVTDPDELARYKEAHAAFSAAVAVDVGEAETAPVADDPLPF